ncbi:MAG: hypothetical protein LIO65_04445 [Odoribacter sp.]|nr:hypothetical protein [Odoribacter sp.]
MSDDINVLRIPKDYGALYVSGDIHGEFRKFLYEFKRKQIQNATVIIAGDCGIGFEKFEYYRQLYNRLS